MNTTCRSRFLWIVIASSVAMAGCSPDDGPLPRRVRNVGTAIGALDAHDDNVDDVLVTDAKGKAVIRQHLVYTQDEAVYASPIPYGQPPPPPAPAVKKVHPRVADLVSAAKPGDRLHVLVSVAMPGSMPLLTAPRPDQPPDSDENIGRMATRQAEIAAVTKERLASQAPVVQLVTSLGGKVEGQHYLGNLFFAWVPPGVVAVLDARQDVVGIEPTGITSPPPSNGLPDGNPNNDVADGRYRIGSDVGLWSTLTSSVLRVGLLDSGVRAAHQLLTSQVGMERYCASASDPHCASPDVDDGCSPAHGTSSDAILAGNSSMGAAYRGILNGGIVDSWKVTTTSPGFPCLSNGDVFGTAMELAVGLGDQVLLVETPFPSSDAHYSSVNAVAEEAFESGAVVVAPVGNWGQEADHGPGAPAASPKVIGAGAYDVETVVTDPVQSYGPTADSRNKPDLQVPTNTETADLGLVVNGHDTALQIFGATSGSGPYAGGAAMLLKMFYGAQWPPFASEPGKIYAALLAFSSIPSRTQPDPILVDSYDNLVGAGRLRLGAAECATWIPGSRLIGNGQASDVSIPYGTGSANLNVALWWPQSGATPNNIDLQILDSAGVVRGYANSTHGVFEVLHIPSAKTPNGTWKARIIGSYVSGTQLVYSLVYHTNLLC